MEHSRKCESEIEPIDRSDIASDEIRKWFKENFPDDDGSMLDSWIDSEILASRHYSYCNLAKEGPVEECRMCKADFENGGPNKFRIRIKGED